MNKRNLFGSAIVIAIVSLFLSSGAGHAASVTVKNYFSPCTGVNCDNVLQLNGTVKIGTLTFSQALAKSLPSTYTAGAIVTTAKKVAYGQQTTVAASDTVVTGLATVTACVASLDSAPTVDPEIASCSVGDQAGTPAAGSVLIQTWKTLGGTPAAATTFTKKVNYVAWGQ